MKSYSLFNCVIDAIELTPAYRSQATCYRFPYRNAKGQPNCSETALKLL